MFNNNNFIAAGVLCMFVLTGCGGGNSNGGAGSVQYDGNTTAANITGDNAKELSNQTFTGADASTATSGPTFARQASTQSSGAFVTGKLLSHTDIFAKGIKPATNLQGRPTAQVNVDYSDACPVSGTVRLIGSVDTVTRLGSLSVTYTDCSDGFVVINGGASLHANAYNADIDEYTDVELIYDNLHFVGVDPADRIDWQVGANLHAEQLYTSDLDPFRKIATINLTLKENITGAAYKYDNYVVDMVYDRYNAPSTATLDINGRLYHYLYGYVDVETINSLVYSNVNPMTYPDAGGPLVYTGEANKKIRLTPVSDVLVNVGADTDGDDFYEYSITVPWVALKDKTPNDEPPVANAGNDVTINLGDTASLDGSLSTDPDYDLITFSWAVTSQPVGSDAGLQGANSANPTLTPNMAGVYELELLVGDGWHSDVDTVVVTVNP